MKRMFEELKKYFSKDYRLQQIGALALIIVLIFIGLGFFEIPVILLSLIGAFDVTLFLFEKKTISQWIHALFPKAIDMIIGIGLLALGWLIFGPETCLFIFIGFILGHLFWQG